MVEAASLARLKERLDAECARLDAAVAVIDADDRQTLSEASGENAYRDHMADQGSATFEREMDLTFEESLRESRAEVRAALERIEDRTYGTCERCSADIPVERMEALPTARLCIACKSAEEQR